MDTYGIIWIPWGQTPENFRPQNSIVHECYPLVICYIAIERSTILIGKLVNHHPKWAIFHSFLYVYQAG